MKFLPLIILSLVLFSCASSKKIKAEFDDLKTNNKISLVFDELKSVEVKSAMDVLFTRYINDAPPEDSLLQLTNQFVLYYLYESGYEMIFEGKSFMKELIDKDNVYYLALSHLEIKEFKFKEEVKDTLKGTVDYVKLKGVETKLEGFVLKPIDGKAYEEDQKKLKSQVSISEAANGEFAHGKSLKDVVLGNKSGSNKYKADVERLGDGLFEYQCQEVARILVEKMDAEIFSIYKKMAKQAN